MKRFTHNASHEVLLTFNQGQYVPIMAFDAAPNETLRLASELVVRTQPLLAPIYAKCKAVISYYAIPNRLVWTNFDQFRTGGATGDSVVQAPYILSPAVTGWPVGSLADYLGFPTGIPNLKCDARPFRAYALVWNDYVRDKDLQPALPISLGDGLDTTTNTVLQNVCWEKNNLTTARPTPQKGTAVSIPLTGNAPVTGVGFNAVTGATTSPSVIRESGKVSTTTYPNAVSLADSATVNALRIRTATSGTSSYPDIQADMSGVSAVNIEALRFAGAIQRFKELMSKFVGGGTYAEFLRLFGVAPQDMRVQWPERLGGGESTIQFSEVLQTAEGTDPVGELRGHGIGVAKGRRVVYHTVEDCVILGMVSVKPKTVYMQAVSKMWNRWSRWDYFMPALQNLGQQPITNKEVDASHAQPDGVFGYQDQYYEYRRIDSRVAGEFRTTLDFWHMAIKFNTPPALNAAFVSAVPTDRVYAAGGAAHQLQVRVWNKIKRKSLVYPEGRPQLK